MALPPATYGSKGCVFHSKIVCQCFQKVDPGVFFSLVFTMGQLAANTNESKLTEYKDPHTPTWYIMWSFLSLIFAIRDNDQTSKQTSKKCKQGAAPLRVVSLSSFDKGISLAA